MNKMSEGPKQVDEYIANQPKAAQRKLNQMRSLLLRLVPDAEEAIRYGIPTLILGGNLVHFAGFEKHVGFYPGAAGVAEFQNELHSYKWGKGSIQFPLNEPIPVSLVTRIVQFREEQNRKKLAGAKKTKSAASSSSASNDAPNKPNRKSSRKATDGKRRSLGKRGSTPKSLASPAQASSAQSAPKTRQSKPVKQKKTSSATSVQSSKPKVQKPKKGTRTGR